MSGDYLQSKIEIAQKMTYYRAKQRQVNEAKNKELQEHFRVQSLTSSIRRTEQDIARYESEKVRIDKEITRLKKLKAEQSALLCPKVEEVPKEIIEHPNEPATSSKEEKQINEVSKQEIPVNTEVKDNVEKIEEKSMAKDRPVEEVPKEIIEPDGLAKKPKSRVVRREE